MPTIYQPIDAFLFRYKDEAVRRQGIFHTKPMTARESAMFWIEHVLKFKGGKHLTPSTTRMSFYQYLNLDIAVVVLALGYIFLKTVKITFGLFKKGKSKLKMN